MMAYMGTVIVILLNILVAQMSTTYSQAKKVARLEYDVDRILQLTRMERFPFLVSKHKYLHSSENWGIILPIAELFLHLFFFGQNLRVKYYKEGDWISEMKLAQGLERKIWLLAPALQYVAILGKKFS